MNNQFLCERLRNRSKDHTYKDDDKLIQMWKEILDLNMSLSMPDQQDLLALLLIYRTAET